MSDSQGSALDEYFVQELLRKRTFLRIRIAPLGIGPFGRWFNFQGWQRSGVFAATSLEPADRADRHIVIACDLATQSNASQAAGFQYIAFGDGHASGFATDEFNTAGGAAGVSAASVQLIDSGVFGKCQD